MGLFGNFWVKGGYVWGKLGLLVDGCILYFLELWGIFFGVVDIGCKKIVFCDECFFCWGVVGELMNCFWGGLNWRGLIFELFWEVGNGGIGRRGLGFWRFRLLYFFFEL